MTRLENKLEQLSSSYHKRYVAMVAQLKDNELNNWQVNAPEFTDHGANHCCRIAEALDRLVPDSVLVSLNEIELYFLLSSVWLHDLGMMCRQIGNEQFMPKDIRERHHELTKRYLMTNSKYRQYIINSELEASIIADICYCHRRVSIPSVFEAKVTVGAQVVNARFLSGLLRIADEMDMDYRRASECTMELISLRGDSADHWKACQLVNGLTCDSQNSVIEISCTIKNDNDRRIATNAARKLNQERQQTVPYFEFGLKYNSIRCRLKNPIDKDEYLVVLNDITEQLFHQVYRKRKGEDFVYRPRVPIQRLMSELEESSGGMP